MQITQRGRAVIAASVALAFSAILFQGDLIITAVLLILVWIVIGEAIWLKIVTRNPDRWFRVSNVYEQKEADGNESPSFSRRSYPGMAVQEHFILRKNGRGALEISSDNEFLHFNPSKVMPQELVSKITAEFSTPFAGEYSSEILKIRVDGPLHLFSENCSIPLTFHYTVFPKVLDVAGTSSRLLGRGGIGEIPIEKPGIGTEFYEMRNYQLGDDYRQVNWKATARRGELIVNEKMREVGSSYYVVLEAYSPDYFDRDRLASAFLQIANSLAMAGARFGIIVHDGAGRIVALKKVDFPLLSLSFALSVALKFADIKSEDIFGTKSSVLMPLPSYLLRSSATTLNKGGSATLADIEEGGRLQLQKALRGDDAHLQTILDVFRGGSDDERPAILYISGLFHWKGGSSLSSVVELASHIRRTYGAEFVLVNPTSPWVVLSNEEEAVLEYQEFLRKLRVLRTANIEYSVGDPVTVANRIFEFNV